MLKLNKQGFTLIELLVVIAIIGILASVTITSLGSAKNKAYKASAQSTASALGTEFIMCEDDGGNIQIPTDPSIGGGNVCDADGHSTTWPTLAETGGYVYTDVTAQAANILQTFTLVSAGNVTLTCSWDGVADYKCK